MSREEPAPEININREPSGYIVSHFGYPRQKYTWSIDAYKLNFKSVNRIELLFRAFELDNGCLDILNVQNVTQPLAVCQTNRTFHHWYSFTALDGEIQLAFAPGSLHEDRREGFMVEYKGECRVNLCYSAIVKKFNSWCNNKGTRTENSQNPKT